MLKFREKKYVNTVPSNIECLLGADIGGTNANFGIFQLINNKPKLILSIHFKSQKIKNFTDVIKQLLDYLQNKYGITIKKATIAAAGAVSAMHDYVNPTNLNVDIDSNEILKHTNLVCVFIINDFEVIGFGLNAIDPINLVQVNKGIMRNKANKIIVGAGTGLGKSIMYYNECEGHYESLASEGGHADFAPQNQIELDLVKFIQKKEKKSCNVSWEDILSGYGIENMYLFFKYRNSNEYANPAISATGPNPDEIFNSREKDEHAWNTFVLYSKLYARCAKNFALDALALGGVYIAGGIAAKNLPLFEQKCFMQEFVNCGKQQELLKEVPIFVITDYDISLYGAVYYMLTKNIC